MIKKLNYLYISDKLMYNKSYASYYGYLKRIGKVKEYDFKITVGELYNLYKEKYNNSVIIIKDKRKYKALDKYILNNKQYTFLIDRLMKLGASFIVANKNDVLIKKDVSLGLHLRSS